MATSGVSIVIWLTSTAALLISGCVTAEKPSVESHLVERSPSHDAAPSWLKGPEKVQDKSNKTYKYRVQISMDDATQGDACVEAAGISGLGKVVTIIASDVMKTAGYSLDERKKSLDSVTTQISRSSVSGIEVVDSYWELREIEDKQVSTRRLDCWVQMEVPQEIIDSARSMVKSLHKKTANQLEEQKRTGTGKEADEEQAH